MTLWTVAHKAPLFMRFSVLRILEGVAISFVQTSFGEFGEVVWARPLKIYKVSTKTGWGPRLRGDSALGPPV